MAEGVRRSLRHGLAGLSWALAGLAAVTVVLACVLVVPQELVQWELGTRTRTLTAVEWAKAVNDVRTTLLQGIGGAVLLLGAFFTYRQLQNGREQLELARDQARAAAEQAREQLGIALQGQVTERFTRAIDQLGHAQLDVRLGGIYALERIAKDSPDDRAMIVEILVAFVRGHSPWPPRLPGQYLASAPIDKLPMMRVRAPDVQAALTVLGRREPEPKWGGYIDLMETDLRKASLVDADFHGSFLVRANLQEANLRRADLQNSILAEANLLGTNLQEADLRGVRFFEARLHRAKLSGARLQGVSFARTDLHGAEFGPHPVSGEARADADTIWPPNFDWRAAGIRDTTWPPKID